MNLGDQLTLRRKFIVYLLAIHVLFAGVVVYLLWPQETRAYVVVVEAVFAGSLILGIRYIRALFVPIEIIRTGKYLIDEQEFTTRFIEVGQIEMDELIRVYNRMVDHLRAERTRLQEQHYFLEQILQNSPAGILIFDYDNRIATVNPGAAALLRLPAASLTGRTLPQVSHPFCDQIEEMEPGASRIIALQGQRRVKCYKSRFVDQGFYRVFVLMEELTNELRLSEKTAFEKLIRITAHEVNNTIGAVNSLLQSCLTYRSQIGEADRPDYVNALSVAMQRNDHLNQFIRSYADVVRLPAPVRRPCVVRDLLERIVSLMQAESRSKRIEWAWDEQEALPSIAMDSGQMEQVFVNIFKNAIDAIDEHGTITIRLHRVDDRPGVIIEDTGCGIPPSLQPELFTPFFTTKPNGQGIGLTLIQEILTGHGFEFALESQPGQPTRFAILFF